MKIKTRSQEARHALTSRLDEHDISYSIIDLDDSSFPSLNEQNGQTLFIVHEPYPATLFQIIEGIPDLDVASFDTAQKSGKKPLVKNLIWVYAIVVTFLLAKFWHMNTVNNRSKNFDYSWNWTNTTLTLTDKKTGKRAYSYYDDNFDFNFERAIEVTDEKGSNSACFDRNEDGYFETIDHYTAEGIYIGTVRDYDFDRIYDEMEVILENGDTIRLFDQNKNGIYDKLVNISSQK